MSTVSASPFKFAKEETFRGRTALGDVKEIKVVSGRAQQRWVFEPQKAIFFEGQPGDAAYLIQKGKVAIVKRDAAGGYVEVARIGPGDLFGEMALIDGRVRTASAVAVDKVETLVLEAKDFDRELAGLDPLASEAISVMLDFVRRMPPRDLWPDGRMPQIGIDIAKVSAILARAAGDGVRIGNDFARALCVRLADYVKARMPAEMPVAAAPVIR